MTADTPAAADTRFHATARKLGHLVEPLAAGVYFAPEALLDARLDGARDQYTRMVGEPDAATSAGMLAAADLLLEVSEGIDMSGRPLFAGLAGLPVPGEDDPLGRLWRAA